MKSVRKKPTLVCFLALIGLASHTEPTFAQANPGNPLPLRSETIACPMSLPEGDIDSETMVCGQIEVPENWNDPGARMLLIT